MSSTVKRGTEDPLSDQSWRREDREKECAYWQPAIPSPRTMGVLHQNSTLLQPGFLPVFCPCDSSLPLSKGDSSGLLTPNGEWGTRPAQLSTQGAGEEALLRSCSLKTGHVFPKGSAWCRPKKEIFPALSRGHVVKGSGSDRPSAVVSYLASLCAGGFPAAETVSRLGMGNRPLGSVSLTVWERSAACGTGGQEETKARLPSSERTYRDSQWKSVITPHQVITGFGVSRTYKVTPVKPILIPDIGTIGSEACRSLARFDGQFAASPSLSFTTQCCRPSQGMRGTCEGDAAVGLALLSVLETS
ncbi:unnamed protein product [Pleuronectes platessa]|uniref:Uncharacterized protein n=1 Tax=Pleuronectes platessa TaxID=8262 RepID=A0A9N7YF55_PLEPL|nr:unnamed protein product [Pleuronectes platessa]